ncbi:hypothetical protein HMPREF0262_02206 [Clostridium sp. ATCC 29733]|nr:hypothetical protein HMPREF0262_02206 [Clostridium sp. ATCC 29733]
MNVFNENDSCMQFAYFRPAGNGKGGKEDFDKKVVAFYYNEM